MSKLIDRVVQRQSEVQDNAEFNAAVRSIYAEVEKCGKASNWKVIRMSRSTANQLRSEGFHISETKFGTPLPNGSFLVSWNKMTPHQYD